MTAQSEKTEQMRLDSCVWAPSKRDKVHETPRQNASETRKNGDFLADTIARVEIIRENSQGHHNMSLLGKYPINVVEDCGLGFGPCFEPLRVNQFLFQ